MREMAIAFGRFDETFKLESFKAYVAEFISTLLFVFAGVGAVIAFGNTSILTQVHFTF